MEVIKITCESHVNHMGDYENHMSITGNIKITCESHENYENHMWITCVIIKITREYTGITCE